MWHYIIVGILVMLITKTSIDKAKEISVPKYVPENYMGWNPPQKQHKRAYMPEEFNTTRFISVLELPKTIKTDAPPITMPAQKLADVNLSKNPAGNAPKIFMPRKSQSPADQTNIQALNKNKTSYISDKRNTDNIRKAHNPAAANQKAGQLIKNLPPELRFVAECESGTHHYHPTTGAVLRGVKNPDDIGIFQINRGYNGSEAQKQGHNIYTVAGNILHAKYMYRHYGLEPWKASRDCWVPKILQWNKQKKFRDTYIKSLNPQ